MATTGTEPVRGVETAEECQKQLSADVIAIKATVDAGLQAVNQKLDKINSFHEELVDMSISLASIEEKISSQTKMQNLAFGIDHASLGSFEYYCDNYCTWLVRSTELVRLILLNFRSGNGKYLPDGRMRKNCHNNQDLEQTKKEFHEALVRQIKELVVGSNPRIAKDSNDGRFIIYYS